MSLTGRGRDKNDIIHLYDGRTVDKWWSDGPREQPLCGAVDEAPDADGFDVEQSDLDEGYVIRNSSIEGKVCGNCKQVATGEVFS